MRRISAIFLAAAINAAAARAAPLAEMQWIAPDADKIAALTQSPGECFSKPVNAEGAWLAEIGRTAFSSPRLLGGQAARAGLSCNSCHVDGRSNNAFFLEGLSGAPGTADVTSSIFSTMREDGVFNPVAIPSLVGIGAKSRFGAHDPKPSLDDFIGSALVEEFNAEPPPAAILEGLIAYIKALDPAACTTAPVAITPASATDDIVRTLSAAQGALDRHDLETFDFLLASAEAMLGRMSARADGAEFSSLRTALARQSRSLQNLRRSPGANDAGKRLSKAARSIVRLGGELHIARQNSLYDPATLARHSSGQESK